MTKPIPVQIEEPEPGPLQVVQSIIGPLLQPMAAGGLVIVFVIMICSSGRIFVTDCFGSPEGTTCIEPPRR